jgi:hypothetical protein
MTTLKQLVADRDEYLDGQRENAGLAPFRLLWSRKHSQWWKPMEAGYTSDILDAGVYHPAHAAELEAWSANNPEHQRTVALPADRAPVPPLDGRVAAERSVAWLLSEMPA